MASVVVLLKGFRYFDLKSQRHDIFIYVFLVKITLCRLLSPTPSILCPAANQVVIQTAQRSHLRIIGPAICRQGLNHLVEIE